MYCGVYIGAYGCGGVCMCTYIYQMVVMIVACGSMCVCVCVCVHGASNYVRKQENG